MKRKSQVSIEYLILTGFIVLLVVVPSVVYLYSILNQNVYGVVTQQKVNDVGDRLLDTAKQMYFLGLYSKRIVDVDIPPNVERMYLATLDDGINKFYYLAVVIVDEDTQKFFFQSEVPITSKVTPPIVTTDTPLLDIKECADPGISCSFFNFEDFVTLPGKKRFKVETITENNDVKVAIIPLAD